MGGPGTSEDTMQQTVTRQQTKTNTRQYMTCTHVDRENTLSVDEAASRAHRNSSSNDRVRGVCVESTHPVMHMPCKKPRPQGVCSTPGQRKRGRKKKCCEIVNSKEPGEGVRDSRC